MNPKFLLLLFSAFLFAGCSEQSLQKTLESVNKTLEDAGGSGLTSQEVAAGLKEALVVGTDNAVDISGVTNGFYKNPELFIPFPEEAEAVKSAALKLGLDRQVEEFEKNLNRAAEEAVTRAQPIFVEAITSMTIQDAFGILNGGDHAATDYLRRKTENSLESTFRPEVQKAIDEVELTKYWNPLATAYNTTTAFSGAEAVNPDLTGYVTENAIDGLFVLIAEEEEKIREDPAARITELLRKVFG